MAENVITKRKVSMRSTVAIPGGYQDHEVKDYVPEEILDQYMDEARGRWQVVEVSDGYDAGPAGYDGETHYPAFVQHEEAGLTRPATPGSLVETQLADAKAAAHAIAVAQSGDMQMAVQTVTMRNFLATAYGANAPWAAASTTAPSGTAGTEVSGGSPAYARKALSWGTAASSAITATAVVFDIPASTTVVGFEIYSASTAGTYYDGCTITSQTFASQGTYSVTPTYTQS